MATSISDRSVTENSSSQKPEPLHNVRQLVKKDVLVLSLVV